MLRVFSYQDSKGSDQIGVEYEEVTYNFTLAWDLYKQLKNRGRGPSLEFLQVMVEADFLSTETFEEVFSALSEVRPLRDLEIRDLGQYNVPVGRPQKILCVGRNYKLHAEELGNKVPEEPLFFCKAPSALLAHQREIRLPPGIGRVDHEGELAVVIGKAACRIAEKYAMKFIAGYTMLNDVTARDLQSRDKEAGHPWFRSKSFDTFCPLGPYLVPQDAIKDITTLDVEVRVNDEVRQHGNTSQMIFSIPEIVSYISKFVTLQPGDIIATGTPAGVGPLQSGDVVACEVGEIGCLTNPVKS